VDRLWDRLVRAMGQPQLADDPRFASYRERDGRAEEVAEVVSAWTRELTSDEIVEVLTSAEVPCGRVNTAADILSGDLAHRLDLLIDVDDGCGGTIAVPRNPLGFGGGGTRVPRCGEDTAAILGEVHL
jgi:crotonobetainyl-CoA:carnitine CoA-transferase CaiB-like acyl-CoA transferase